MNTLNARLLDSKSTRSILANISAHSNSVDLKATDANGISMLDLSLSLKENVLWLSVRGLGTNGTPMICVPVSRMM